MGSRRTLGGVIRLFQAIRIVLFLAVIVIAAVPLLVVIDLIGGGRGLGLCPNRLRQCESSYFDGPELMAALTAALFILVALIRVMTLITRRLQEHRDRIKVADPPPRRWLARRS